MQDRREIKKYAREKITQTEIICVYACVCVCVCVRERETERERLRDI